MGKLRVGHKQNSIINREWAKHVRGLSKRLTSKKRRKISKNIIKTDNNDL